MSTRSGGSGIGQRGDDPSPGGSNAGAERHDSRIGDRQAVEGREADDLGAASEDRMLREGARSTPPMGDVRSDAGAGAGPGNGEPL
jgi:hypothetical protein